MHSNSRRGFIVYSDLCRRQQHRLSVFHILSWLRSSLSFPASQAVSGGFWSLTMTPIIQLLNLYATLTLLHQKAWALRHSMDEREDYLEAEGFAYHSAIVARVRAHLDSLITWCDHSLDFIHRALLYTSKDLD